MDDTPLLDRSRGTSLWSRFRRRFRERCLTDRAFTIGQLPEGDFVHNNVCNQKYNLFTFLPLVLYEEFKFFYNIYFLVMAILQFFPSISIGQKLAYWGPLGFVLGITLLREAILDFRRYWRDREINLKCYERVVLDHRPFKTESVAAKNLRVGDIVKLHKSERIPADMILLRTSEPTGRVFIRTDQLDGESNWKLRISLSATRDLISDALLLDSVVKVFADKPDKDIHTFIGNWEANSHVRASLTVDNTLWSGCVLASDDATGLVIYTGADTRAVMNTPAPRTKVGKLDMQINNFTVLLFVASIGIAFLLIILKGFEGLWLNFFTRFVLLFSYIIPISLSVNLTLAKTYFSLWIIQTDKNIAGTVMRSMTIPEELGRVQYLLADKTGTLTNNEMVFKKIFMNGRLYDSHSFDEVQSHILEYNSGSRDSSVPVLQRAVYNSVLALALCHNVTPSHPRIADNALSTSSNVSSVSSNQDVEYQAASPDEVALVKWTEIMGISLYERELNTISLKIGSRVVKYTILHIFPFTSETKMMSIIVQHKDVITYYVKGADTAFPDLSSFEPISKACHNLAEEGFRTLIVAMKQLTQEEYRQFEEEYSAAAAALDGRRRGADEAAARSRLHVGVTPLAVTGVEDTLAPRVHYTLTLLKEAGIKIWMLTGDKLESARCIARSLQLGNSCNVWQTATPCVNKEQAYYLLTSFEEQQFINLVIEGDTLEWCLREYSEKTVSLLLRCGGVVVARCSPTQKAQVAAELAARAGVAAAGDGGNDVAMIRRAHIGIGIEGKEGLAAALAADVSVRQFWCIGRLLLLHGRRASLASAALTMFIVHRGIVISTMQAIFSAVFYFSSVPLYPSILMVGYATFYTVLPVFSLVLDKDISTGVLLTYPHLYKKIPKGRHYSFKTFLGWMAVSILQGAIIMFGALILFNEQLIHIVEISYTALILTELIMVAITIRTWHYVMVLAEVVSLLGYTITLIFYTSYFDADFIRHWAFWWKVMATTLMSCSILIFKKIYTSVKRNRKLTPTRISGS